MKKIAGTSDGPSASESVSKRIADLGDWRGEALARMRKLIHGADPGVVEELKWRGTPVWSHDGILCTGESYRDKVKLTFAKGASLKDPAKLFNSSLEGNQRRAIDIHEGEEVDAAAFRALVLEAVARNLSGETEAIGRHMASKRPTTIAEYIQAAPAEGQPSLRRLHALLKRVAPEAEEAIKWGQPFFVEPRFLFAFSANKAHLNFAPSASALQHFRKELAAHRTTKNYLQVRYEEELPEELIRKLAEYQLGEVRKRKDEAFW